MAKNVTFDKQKGASENKDALPEFLHTGGPRAEIKEDLEKALASYAASHQITVGSPEWKNIALKLLIPTL